MILEANFTESNHELPCDATVAVVVNEGGEVPNDHINDKNNPHQVTTQQIGAVSGPIFDAVLSDIADNINEVSDRVYLVEDGLLELKKPYELIQSFTLTEDTKTVELNGFELDKFVLYVTTPIYEADGGCRVNMYKGEDLVFSEWVNYILDKDEVNAVGFYGRNESGLAFIEWAVGNYAGGKTIYTVPKYVEGIYPFTKISFVMAACVFPVGTKFELWGVRR